MTSTDAEAYDARLFADARQLANLQDSDAIRAWFTSTGRDLDGRDNPYAAAFGTLQALTHELLCTISRAAQARNLEGGALAADGK